jgi:preprotein translocase subunit YajC
MPGDPSLVREVVLGLFLLQQSSSSPSSSPLGAFGGILPLVLVFGIFYVLVFMPMQRQKKNQQKMLANLENGNVVLTSGGIVGTIVAIEKGDDTLVLRVKPDNVKIQVARSSVSSLVAGEPKGEVKK